MIREGAISHITNEVESPIGRACLQVASTDAPAPVGDGSWACQVCTMVNTEAASRCLACHARQPAKYVGHKSAPPQRHQYVVAKPARRERRASNGAGLASRKRIRHTSTAAAVLEDMEGIVEADEKERADEDCGGIASAAMPISRMSMLPSHGERQQTKGGATHACQKRMLENKLACAGAMMPSATSVTEPLTDATRACDDWPLVRSICDSKSGFKNVAYNGSRRLAKPWQARADDGKSLGMHATPEEAAMAYSKHIGFEAASLLAKVEAASSKSLTSEEALQAAAREGLTLRPAKAKTSSPYFGVYRIGNGPRSYLAKAYDYKGQRFNLGCFHTAEEAALELARFQELQRGQLLIEKDAATNAAPTPSERALETGDAQETGDKPAPAKKKKRARPSNADKMV